MNTAFKVKNRTDIIKHLFICFFIYSVIGWCYEVFLEVVIYRWGFSNRGVLFGPYCPVYGVGALLFIFLIYPILKNKSLKFRLLMIPVVFLLCMFVATVTELAVSYICEALLGSWPWSYAGDAYNFQGRIALSPSVRFGIGGVVFMYMIQPVLDNIGSRISARTRNVVFTVLLIAMGIDSVGFFIKLIFA